MESGEEGICSIRRLAIALKFVPGAACSASTVDPRAMRQAEIGIFARCRQRRKRGEERKNGRPKAPTHEKGRTTDL